MEIFRDFFEQNGITVYGCVPYDDRFVLNEPYLAKRYSAERRALLSFAVPYYVQDERRNISIYAVSKDYHLYFKELFADLKQFLVRRESKTHFCAFADVSPFAERTLAAACGLGTVGDNGLLINETYGSFVFLGSIITDLAPDLLPRKAESDRTCIHCERCKTLCPSPDNCLSSITQTKGELPVNYRRLIAAYGCAWGCDICQTVCPANRDLPESPIEFFHRDRMPIVTTKQIETMSDEDFSARAYAWKGKACILRNLSIIEHETEL